MLLYCQRYKISKNYSIHYWRICFIKINSGSMRKTMCNQSRFISYYLIIFIYFLNENPLEPNTKDSRRYRYHVSEHFFFLSELSSASIASFYLLQSEHFLHSAMVLWSESFRKFWAMIVEKHRSVIVVLWSYTFLELV
jgi:hypothetical protein